MAGLLAAAILRDECDSVIEAQSGIPNNHNSLLRFRSPVVGDAVNIPFDRVTVVKAIYNPTNPVADAISYSVKTNGTARLRSIVNAAGESDTRYIAPPDFISRLADKVGLTSGKFAFDVAWELPSARPDGSARRPFIISTIPMPVLRGMVPAKKAPIFGEEFRSITGWSIRAKLRDTDLCASLYFPNSSDLAYRASITRDQLIVEFAFPGKSPEEASRAMSHLADYPKNLYTYISDILGRFGIPVSFVIGKPEVKNQPYAKILPIPEEARKRFILQMSEEHGIYSLGRFATWRPGLLLDDLVNDLRVIQRLAAGGSSYDARKA